MNMQISQWLLVAIMIADGFICGYYQLQMVAYSKAGMLGKIWRGGWIFHPEYLEKDGQPYRKKVLACLVIFIFLVALMKMFPTK